MSKKAMITALSALAAGTAGMGSGFNYRTGEYYRSPDAGKGCDTKHEYFEGALGSPKKIKKGYGQKKMTRAQRKKYYSKERR